MNWPSKSLPFGGVLHVVVSGTGYIAAPGRLSVDYPVRHPFSGIGMID
ncbi:MAG: hypothetical protein P8076_05535 [Gammaproteobacteria bacterium]